MRSAGFQDCALGAFQAKMGRQNAAHEVAPDFHADQSAPCGVWCIRSTMAAGEYIGPEVLTQSLV